MKFKLPLCLLLILMLLSMKLNSQVRFDPLDAIRYIAEDSILLFAQGGINMTFIPKSGRPIHSSSQAFLSQGGVNLGKKRATYYTISSSNRLPPPGVQMGVEIGSLAKTQSFGTFWLNGKPTILPKTSLVNATGSRVSNQSFEYIFKMEFEGNMLIITVYGSFPG